MFACLIIHTFQLVFQSEQYFSLITNQRTILLAMPFQRTEQDLIAVVAQLGQRHLMAVEQ
jgi:hypothetical protein